MGNGTLIYLGIGAGALGALAGLSALLDGINQFQHARYWRAAATMALGVGMIAGGIALGYRLAAM